MSGEDATLVVLIAICVLYIVITEVQKLLKGKLQAAIRKSQNPETVGQANTTSNSSDTIKVTSASDKSSSAVQQTTESNPVYGQNNPVSSQGDRTYENCPWHRQHDLITRADPLKESKTPQLGGREKDCKHLQVQLPAANTQVQRPAAFQGFKHNKVCPVHTTSNSSGPIEVTSDSNGSSSDGQQTTKSNPVDQENLYENFQNFQEKQVSSQGDSIYENSAQPRQHDLNKLAELLKEFKPKTHSSQTQDLNGVDCKGLIKLMIKDNDLRFWPTLTDKAKDSLFQAMQTDLDEFVDAYVPTMKEKKYNRYRAIYPSKEHRIIMIRDHGFHQYYNGDHVKVGIDKNLYKYFAFQGPTEETIIDYWTVVSQNRLKVVVKLTRDTEDTIQGGTIVKCADYFKGVNEDNRSIFFENYDGNQNKLKVTLLENRVVTLEGDKNALEIRLFEVKPQGGSSLKTVNIFYPNWDDFSSLNPKALLRFNSFSRGEDLEGVWTKLMRKDSSWKEIQDILIDANRNMKTGIHCSAGIGRTGTYMVDDLMISEFLRGAPDFQLLKVLQGARACRPKLVQKYKQLDTLIDIKLKLFPRS